MQRFDCAGSRRLVKLVLQIFTRVDMPHVLTAVPCLVRRAAGVTVKRRLWLRDAILCLLPAGSRTVRTDESHTLVLVKHSVISAIKSQAWLCVLKAAHSAVSMAQRRKRHMLRTTQEGLLQSLSSHVCSCAAWVRDQRSGRTVDSCPAACAKKKLLKQCHLGSEQQQLCGSRLLCFCSCGLRVLLHLRAKLRLGMLPVIVESCPHGQPCGHTLVQRSMLVCSALGKSQPAHLAKPPRRA